MKLTKAWFTSERVTALGLIALAVIGSVWIVLPGTRQSLHWRIAAGRDTPAAYASYLDWWRDGSVNATEAANRLDELDWAAAKSANRVVALETYRQDHPVGRHQEEAFALLDELRWREAIKSGAIGPLNTYLSVHPSGKHVAAANEMIESLRWREATQIQTVAIYREYLASYPKGRYVAEAQSRIEELWWQKAMQADSIEAYNLYLKNEGELKHADEAKRRIENLCWKTSRDAMTVASLQNYLAQYPNGAYVAEAKARQQTLRQDEKLFEPAARQNTEQALREFLRDYPGHVKEAEARNRLGKMLLAERSDAKTRLDAVAMLEDQEALLRLVLNAQAYASNDQFKIYEAALAKLKDEQLLVRVAAESPNRMLAQTALNKLSDPTLLEKLAVSTTDTERMWMAIGKLTGKSCMMAGYGRMDQRNAAVRALSQPAILEKLSRRAEELSVRQAASERLRQIAGTQMPVAQIPVKPAAPVRSWAPASPKPAPPANTSTEDVAAVRETLLKLRRAAVAGDAAAVQSLLYVTTPRMQRLSAVMAESFVASARFEQAARDAFGADAVRIFAGGSMMVAEEKILTATVQTNAATATVTMDRHTVYLARDAEQWKLRVTGVDSVSNDDVERLERMMNALAGAMNQTREEIVARRYPTAVAAKTALDAKVQEALTKTLNK